MAPSAVNHAPPKGREMTALAHLKAMLEWWITSGIHRADLAVRRCNGVMIWHRDLTLEALPLAWARAENVRRAETYVRPARGRSWPLVFIDDVPLDLARRIARRTSSLVVQTSVSGGCHVWLRCSRLLNETERLEAQRWLARELGGDRASVSGEHLGRLAGFKNWKRGGCWVNVIEASRGRCWNPRQAQPLELETTQRNLSSQPQSDTSASAREWGWTCGLLESGHDPEEVLRRLLLRATRRRRREPERYATRTWERARQHVATRANRSRPFQGNPYLSAPPRA